MHDSCRERSAAARPWSVLSSSLPVCLSELLIGRRSQLIRVGSRLNYSLLRRTKGGHICLNAPFELTFLHQCQSNTDTKLRCHKAPFSVNLVMTGQSSRGNGCELYVCRSCHTPFVFWSGTHVGWSPRRCVRRVTWFKYLPALSVLQTCSEWVQPMRDEAPCYSDTAGCWVIYNTCESDQMQIVHADD